MLCVVVGHIEYFTLYDPFIFLFFILFLGIVILKQFSSFFLFICSAFVCTPPYTTIAHLWIPLASKPTL